VTTLAADRERYPIAAALAASVLLHAGVLAVTLWEYPREMEPPTPLTVELAPQPLPVAAEPEEKPRPAPRVEPVKPPPPPPKREPPPRTAVPTPATAPAPVTPAPVAAPSPVPALVEAAAPAAPAPAAITPPGPAASEPRASAPAAAPATPPAFGAAYLRNPPPRYPPDARRSGAEGTAVLRVWVGADGQPTRVEIDRSSGHRALDDAALSAVRNWRFVPAQRGGEAVEGVVTVPLVFRLDGRG
jgi:periplasmic protein TonB